MGAPAREWFVRGVAAAAVVTLTYAWLSWPAPGWLRLAGAIAVILVAAAIAFVVVPAFDPLARVRWRVTRADGQRCCAITFDDGPHSSTMAVLEILAAEQVKATFFVLGEHVVRHPDVVQRAQAEGHVIAIHGMDHAKLLSADELAVDRQVTGAIRALAEARVTAAKLYRPPHGVKSPAVLAVARRHGLTLWAWTRGVWDTDRPAAGVLVRRATRLARSGMVLLLHDGRGDEVDPDIAPMLRALPEIIRTLRRRGFTFVTLADA